MRQKKHQDSNSIPPFKGDDLIIGRRESTGRGCLVILLIVIAFAIYLRLKNIISGWYIDWAIIIYGGYLLIVLLFILIKTIRMKWESKNNKSDRKKENEKK